MKRYFLLLMFVGLSPFAIAQHFGGLQYSPIFLKNTGQNFNWSLPEYTPDLNETTIGYSVGYQGLLFPDKRFSFGYGFNYVKTSYRYLDDSYYLTSGTPGNERIGIQVTYQDFEVPLTLRWNLLKKSKFQPYLSLAPVLIIPIKTQEDYLYLNNSTEPFPNSVNRKLGITGEIGAGLNYHITDKLIINLHMSYRQQTSDIHRFGVGLGLIFRF